MVVTFEGVSASGGGRNGNNLTINIGSVDRQGWKPTLTTLGDGALEITAELGPKNLGRVIGNSRGTHHTSGLPPQTSISSSLIYRHRKKLQTPAPLCTRENRGQVFTLEDDVGRR